MPFQFTCPSCATPFEGSKRARRYCSHRCADLGRRRTVEERFWGLVSRTESCWLWTGSLDSHGYGVLHSPARRGVLRKWTKAHRLSWVLHFGAIPDDLKVCHDCDRDYPVGSWGYRRCVRPDHLFLGTQKQNIHDAVTKGRNARGERASAAKLTTEDILAIRRLRATTTRNALAHQFGVSPSTISRVMSRASWGGWRWLKDDHRQ